MLLPYFQNVAIEAGLDEAGRGCFAGPVYAAAVILPPGFHHPLLNDSKQLSEEERDLLRPVIEKESIAFAVAAVDNEEIDAINILQASFKAMHLSLDKIKIKPGLLLIDGNRFKPYTGIPHECIVQGDGKYSSIAAASVLPKPTAMHTCSNCTSSSLTMAGTRTKLMAHVFTGKRSKCTAFANTTAKASTSIQASRKLSESFLWDFYNRYLSFQVERMAAAVVIAACLRSLSEQ